MKYILQIQDKSRYFDYPKPKLKIKIIFLISGDGVELFSAGCVESVLFLLNQKGNYKIFRLRLGTVFRVRFGVNNLKGISGR